jgi:hypothetical protein
MESVIQSVTVDITLVFKNNVEYKINFVDDGDEDTDEKTVGISCSLDENIFDSIDTNIIGDVSSNTLTLEISSRDGLLISSNEDSKFYGFMNDTAQVKLSVTDEYNNTTFMGLFFVTEWNNDTTSSNYYTVTITCESIMQKIKDIVLQKFVLQRRVKFSTYLASVIDYINNSLSKDLKIKYTYSTLKNIEKIYNTNWQIEYYELNNKTVETVLNTLALDTLSWIWIDRDNVLKVDCLQDDTEDSSVCELTGSTNLLSYNISDGNIRNYSGIRVKYIKDVKYSDKQVLSVSDVNLTKGSNNELDYTLSSDQTYTVHTIEIDTTDGYAYPTSVYSDSSSIEFNITSSTATTASITAFGKVFTPTYKNKTKYKDNNNKDVENLLTIENYLLRGDCIDTYRDNFLRLINLKNNIITVTGWLNPALTLGNTVAVQGTRLGISGYYKIVSMSFDFGLSYEATATMVRVINAVPSFTSITEEDLTTVTNINNGYINESSSFKELDDTETSVVNNEVGDILTTLSSIALGGSTDNATNL